MKKLIFLLLLCQSAYAQQTKFTIAQCDILSPDGKRDTVFTASEGNVYCTIDMDSMRLDFDWQTKELTALKRYKILDKNDIKGSDWTTMGIYSMKLKCLNKFKKPCDVEFALNTRVNTVNIIITDGEYTVFYDAIQTQ